MGVGGLIVRLFWEKILPDTDPDTAPAGDYGDADDDDDDVVKLADELITCHLPDDDDEFRKVVREVQTHHHTMSCRKKDKINCRYEYPRFPSKYTIIAKPLDDSLPEEEKMLTNRAKGESKQQVPNRRLCVWSPFALLSEFHALFIRPTGR